MMLDDFTVKDLLGVVTSLQVNLRNQILMLSLILLCIVGHALYSLKQSFDIANFFR